MKKLLQLLGLAKLPFADVQTKGVDEVEVEIKVLVILLDGVVIGTLVVDWSIVLFVEIDDVSVGNSVDVTSCGHVTVDSVDVTSCGHVTVDSVDVTVESLHVTELDIVEVVVEGVVRVELANEKNRKEWKV